MARLLSQLADGDMTRCSRSSHATGSSTVHYSIVLNRDDDDDDVYSELDKHCPRSRRWRGRLSEDTDISVFPNTTTSRLDCLLPLAIRSPPDEVWLRRRS